MNEPRYIPLGRFLHGALVLLLVGVVAWVLYELRAALIPFIIAVLLAYMMEPTVERLQRLVKNRGAAVIITLFLVFGAIIGIFMLIVPMMAREVAHFGHLMAVQFPLWQQQVQDLPWMRDALAQVAAVDLQQYLTAENLLNIARKALPGFWQGISSVFGWLLGLVGVFTTLMYLLFILIDEEDVKANLDGMIPLAYRGRVMAVLGDLERVMELYFRGQVKIALILCVIYSIGFLLMGLPMALALGILAGLLSLIPYFALLSALPVCLSCGLLAMETGRSIWVIMLLALAVYAVAQAIEGYVLIPRIQGKSTGLRPVYILLALSVWGSLLGLVGMILALPLTTVMLSYYRREVLGEEEPPPAREQPPAPPVSGVP